MNRGSKAGPKLCRHKRSGAAYAKFNGRQVWFGPYDDRATHAEFAALKAQWEASGRRLPQYDELPDVTVDALADGYEEHAKVYYRRIDGSQTGEAQSIKYALVKLRELFGCELAGEFGLAKLKAVREAMIAAELARPTINGRIARIVRMFGWAAEEQKVPPQVFGALRALRPLKKGRSLAKETKARGPVAKEDVDETLPHLSPPLRALVLFMWHTAARVGEAVQLRNRDVDRSGEVWLFTPAQHKLLHREKPRVIAIGPECRKILEPFVKLDPDAWWFSPVDVLEEQSRERRANRQTPLWDAHVRRYEREKAAREPRKVTDRYTSLVVAHAVRRACKAAGVSKWSPHQLRHAALSRIRREKGIEAAAAIAGHSAVGMTEHYSWEAQKALAIQAAAQTG